MSSGQWSLREISVKNCTLGKIINARYLKVIGQLDTLRPITSRCLAKALQCWRRSQHRHMLHNDVPGVRFHAVPFDFARANTISIIIVPRDTPKPQIPWCTLAMSNDSLTSQIDLPWHFPFYRHAGISRLRKSPTDFPSPLSDQPPNRSPGSFSDLQKINFSTTLRSWNSIGLRSICRGLKLALD